MTAALLDGAAPRPRARTPARLGLAVVCLLALWTGGRGITNEADVSMHGDVPRHLMNGVFLFDLVRDHPFGSIDAMRLYAQRYYARYPALSLGHHPPLLAIAEAPMFGLFGVSVFSARLVTLAGLLGATALLYLLMLDLYGVVAALMAGALFATSPAMISLTRSVFTEMPALALVMATAYLVHRFCLAPRGRLLVGIVVMATLALYAKQLVVFVFPALLLTAVWTLGIKRVLQRDVLLAAVAIVLLSIPLDLLTLTLSKGNIAVTMTGLRAPVRGAVEVLRTAVQGQMATAVVWLAAIGLLRALVTRDRRAILLVLWIGSVLAGLLVAGRLEPVRYSVYWLPAVFGLAASACAGWRRPMIGGAVTAALAVALVMQFIMPSRMAALQGAGGYEEAAEFVTASQPGPTVLFSGTIDTGFFVFFVRKHDAARHLVVLRADKVLTTSNMSQLSVEERIQQPGDIYRILRTFGTRYVVIEDMPSPSPVLEWLRTEVHTPNFAERVRIPVRSSDVRLAAVTLVVYEFLAAGPPDPNATLSMNLPLIGHSVAVRLSDLAHAGAQ